MKEIEIAASERSGFLSGFAQQHFGWLVRLRVRSDVAEQPPTEYSALTSLELLQNGDIRIGLAEEPKLAPSVRSVRLLQTDAGADAGLELVGANDTVVTLEFRVAAHPETIDGILPSEAA
jgi:hypothetical protein